MRGSTESGPKGTSSAPSAPTLPRLPSGSHGYLILLRQPAKQLVSSAARVSVTVNKLAGAMSLERDLIRPAR